MSASRSESAAPRRETGDAPAMRRGVYVTSGGDEEPPLCSAPGIAGRLDAVDLYELAGMGLARSLTRYAAVLLPIHVDQRLLAGQREELEAYLEGGGTIVINGHVAHPFLAALRPFVPLDKPGLPDLRVVEVTPHPIFEGVDRHDITYRRGVAGFYGRGHNPPPAGATILNGLRSADCPVDWTCRWPGGGRVLMHSGNNMWMYLNEKTSAARIPRQLVDWVLSEEHRA